jgi:hypothetical protein
MLRPQMHPYYAAEVEAVRRELGDFVLINTNFNHVNAFGADMNLFKPAPPGERAAFGRAARGMSREYAEGLRDHKRAVMADFEHMIPRLEESFPEITIVVRPHPTESHEPYRKIAERCRRVRVTNQGNVVPWLLSARALIHNGCTTGVEAFELGVPALSYRATVNETYDNGFYRLPNAVSHNCFGYDALQDALRGVLEGRVGAADGSDRRALVRHHLSAQDGPLACERILDVLEGIAEDQSRPRSMLRRLDGWATSKGLQVLRRVKSLLPGSHNRPEFQRHRYPGMPLDEVAARLERFQHLLGDTTPLTVEPVTATIYRVRAR